MRPNYEEWLLNALLKYGVGNEQVWGKGVDYRAVEFNPAHMPT